MRWLTLASVASAASMVSAALSSSSTSSSKTSSSSASAALAPSLTTSLTNTFITIPLAVPSDDAYYNAQVTDGTGNQMGVRVDLLQPDVWLMNGLDIIDCSVLVTYLKEHSGASTALSISYSNEEWAASVCHMAGAYTPETVITTTEASTTSTYTLTINVNTAALTSVGYPNGIFAEGVMYYANLSLGTTLNNKVDLTDFRFILADDSNMYAGGLGLSRHPDNLGLLGTLKQQGRILGSGYSLFLSGYENLNSTGGELLLGAVNKKYFTGSLYLFPYIPYEGWNTQLGAFAPLPIMALESLFLENIDTGEQVTLSSGVPLPLVLDTRLSYSFLPLDYIIDLAIQTNAYYNSEYRRWIVRCLDITSSNATIHFQFGPLDVSIPLSALIYDAYYGESFLYFTNGERACFLNVMPDTLLGYSSLGLPFLSHVYLAMDNEAGNVAMAAGNPNVTVNTLNFDFSQSASTFASYSASQAANATNATAGTTIAYIQSGFIPFATSVNYTSDNSYTMTFFSANSSNAQTIPTRFTMATIQSGEVYLTGGDASTVSGPMASASAANAHTLKSEGLSVKSYFVSREASIIPYVLLLTGTVMALMIV
ncbi:CIC11C00000002983 [Sungouiella intermedia]|uniref:CIC11C00000002983 n=1 Tax=Sungouiella intermedia TaxID=45354 RepID=A0A1L0CTL1_9ASCO|nr:CIC11C00000002983 [[Candida] intermedia]